MSRPPFPNHPIQLQLALAVSMDVSMDISIDIFMDISVDWRLWVASPACPTLSDCEIGFVSSSFSFRARTHEQARQSCASACGAISLSLGFPGGSK